MRIPYISQIERTRRRLSDLKKRHPKKYNQPVNPNLPPQKKNDQN